jgi:type II secretory pathway component PulF
MKKQALVNFYRQLAALYESGVPLLKGLEGLGGEFGGEIARAAQALKAQLANGQTLGEGMLALGTMFPKADSYMVQAGEKSGTIDRVLILMADQHETFHQLRNQLMVRLIYPIILIHVAVLVMAVLKFAQEGMSIWAGLQVLITFVVVVYGGGFSMNILLFGPGRIHSLRAMFDTLVYPLPVVKPLIQAIARLRFSRAFQVLYLAGVNHVKAVQVAADSCGNVFMKKKFLKALPFLNDSQPFDVAMAATEAFPPTLQGMISTGVQSGRLEEMFDKIGAHCEDSVKTRVQVLSIVVPVVLYLIVAIYIATFVFNFYAGYFRQFETLGF